MDTAKKSTTEDFEKMKESQGVIPAVEIYWRKLTLDFFKTLDVESLLKITTEIAVVGYGDTRDKAFTAYMSKAEDRTIDELAKDYNRLQYFFPIDIVLMDGWSGNTLFLSLIRKKCESNKEMWMELYTKANNHSDLKKEAEKALGQL